MNLAPLLVCSSLAAIAVAACFPAVESEADTDVAVQDSSGLETASGGDTTTQDSTSPDTATPDCSSLDRVCARGVNTPFGYCTQLKLHGDPCDDGNPCTEYDACDAGACVGTPVDCDDGVACSTEVCSVNAGGCVYDATACPCADDGDCADGKPCTSDVCDRTSWTCVNDIVAGNSCNDFDPCTSDDRCDESGGCAGTAIVCDDGNSCTADFCDAGSGTCVFESLEGESCDDGDVCSVADTCGGGQCAPGRLANFSQAYPAYAGPFARLLLNSVDRGDGSFLVVERRIYTGPESGGLQGGFVFSASSAGAQTDDVEGFAVHLEYQAEFEAVQAMVARNSSALYVLTNQARFGRVPIVGGSVGWQVSFPAVDGPGARGLAMQDGVPVLCGTTMLNDAPRLWLGWVDEADGSVASSVEPEGGEGVRGVAIRAIASGFIVAGLVDGSDGDDLWVGRLDEAGAILWQKSYPAPLDQTPVTILPTTTAINVVARTASPVDGTERAWIVRLDYAGEPLGETIPSDAELHVADAVDTPDGGLLVVGQRPKDTEWFRQAHVLWLDGQGALVGEHDGPDANNGYTSVRRTETGYILTGSSGDLYYDSAGVLEVTDFELNTPCDPTP